jgi:hypothetical protein
METTQPKRTAIDAHQVFEFARTNRECGHDARIQVLKDLASASAQYEKQLRWLVEKLSRELENYQMRGIRSVDPSLLRTSLVHEVTEAAVQITMLRGILEWTTKAKTDPDATALDLFINDQLNPGA